MLPPTRKTKVTKSQGRRNKTNNGEKNMAISRGVSFYGQQASTRYNRPQTNEHSTEVVYIRSQLDLFDCPLSMLRHIPMPFRPIPQAPLAPPLGPSSAPPSTPRTPLAPPICPPIPSQPLPGPRAPDRWTGDAAIVASRPCSAKPDVLSLVFGSFQALGPVVVALRFLPPAFPVFLGNKRASQTRPFKL